MDRLRVRSTIRIEYVVLCTRYLETWVRNVSKDIRFYRIIIRGGLGLLCFEFSKYSMRKVLISFLFFYIKATSMDLRRFPF